MRRCLTPYAGSSRCKLAKVFESESDPGLHAAAQWLLEKWNRGANLKTVLALLLKGETSPRVGGDDRRQWYVNGQGQTFVIVDAARPFLMGSPPSEHGDEKLESPHVEAIGRKFAIAACPVTMDEFRRFQPRGPRFGSSPSVNLSTDGDLPEREVIWFEAAAYCNWLSEQEHIPREQWCYELNELGKFAEGMRVKKNYLELTGYRLPTEAEWEFACRAGTTTRYYFGATDALLDRYAWYGANSDGQPRPVARKKPNDFGLFDMCGNVWEWCEWPAADYSGSGDVAIADRGNGGIVTYNRPAALRGGAYDIREPNHLRSAFRYRLGPNYHERQVGFRPARTIRVLLDK